MWNEWLMKFKIFKIESEIPEARITSCDSGAVVSIAKCSKAFFIDAAGLNAQARKLNKV